MRRYCIISVMTLCLMAVVVSCSSDEKKISKLIDAEMFRTLDDYSSYEPVSMEMALDTLFPIDDPVILSIAGKYMDAEEDMLRYAEKRQEALWSYRGARKPHTREKYMASYKKYDLLHEQSVASMAELADSVSRVWARTTPRELMTVRHTYRSRDLKGISRLYDKVFYLEPDLSSIVMIADRDDDSAEKRLLVKRLVSTKK